MKKIILIVMLLTTFISKGQPVIDRFQFTQNGKILFDTSLVRPVERKDSLIYVNVPGPCDTTKKFSAVLYCDKWLSRLGVAAEEDKTVNYALQTGYTTLGIYNQNDVFGIPLMEIKQRAFNKKAHKAGLKLEAEISGSQSSVAAFLKFNKDCNDPLERFDFANAEWEPWNQTDLTAAAIKDTTQLKAQKIALTQTNIPGSEYWGWLKKFSSKFQEVLMKNTAHLPLHYYQSVPSISYHGTELDSLNAICKRTQLVYDIRPIFSFELAFSQAELKRIGSVKKIFDNWKIQFDAKKYSNLICTGYYGFAQSHQEVAIPYKAPSSFLRTVFPRKYIQDSFINETSQEHLKLSIPPNED